MSNFHINDNVIVSHTVTGHEFTATVEHIYSEDSPKFGLIRVVDQDDDVWDVGETEIWIDDEDDEHDPFRNDVEADADALAGAGFGTDEDYEHGNCDDD